MDNFLVLALIVLSKAPSVAKDHHVWPRNDNLRQQTDTWMDPKVHIWHRELYVVIELVFGWWPLPNVIYIAFVLTKNGLVRVEDMCY